MTEVKIVQVSEKDLPELIAISRETSRILLAKTTARKTWPSFWTKTTMKTSLGEK